MLRSLPRPAAKSLIVPLLLFATLTALSARITIPLPFTVVPITLQTLAVILSGLVLGSRAGALSQAIYLAAILAGFPISASGIGGPAAFVTPTAGYLIAFVPAAFVAGLIVESFLMKKASTILVHTLAGICAMWIIYIGGVAWLTIVLGNFQVALQQGLLPFIAIDIAKAIIAALVAGGGRLLLSSPS